MALRTIVTLPDEVLKRKAHAVTKFDEKLQALIDDMIETMRPSELRALGKQFNIDINIRMTPEEVSIAKKQLIEKM